MYPFYNDIGKMKVSLALPILGFLAKENKVDFMILPPCPHGNIHLAGWRNNAFKVLERMTRNNQRKN